jgi:acyl-CoA synthetase (AMP-forming)/AMP-acid ligase II
MKKTPLMKLHLLGEKLYKLTGVHFVEGYGLSETIAQTHTNPPDLSKMQCLGIPTFDVDARIIDPVTHQELGVGEVGEIVINGPQVMVGYYNRDEENRNAFILNSMANRFSGQEIWAVTMKKAIFSFSTE